MGEIIDTTWCLNFENQSYASYFPSYYSKSETYPVLYIFDPAARGKHAIEVFNEAAEEFGFLIFCSNNSRNGPIKNALEAYDAMKNDTYQKNLIDSNRVFVTGFSGGSRMAFVLASKHPEIKGVIACGAGLPSNMNLSKQANNFVYYGIIGNLDMNIQDMNITKNYLNEKKIDNHIQYFDDTHTWPNTNEIKLALSWVSFKTDSVNTKAKSFYLKKQKKNINELKNKGRIYDAFLIAESLSEDFEAKEIMQLKDELENNKKLSRQIKSRNKAYKLENEKLKTYYNFFSQYPYKTALNPDTVHTFEWWKNEINYLKKLEKIMNSEKSFMASRLLNSINASCAQSLWDYVKYKDIDKAIFIVNIWLEVYPDKFWPNWNAAKIYAISKNKKITLKLIKKLIELEIDTSWFMKTKEFDFMKGDVEFQEILNN